MANKKQVARAAAAAAQNRPSQQTADKGIAQSDPGGGQAEIPAKLTGITHKNHRREVGRAKGKGGEPGANGASAQHKAIHVGGVLAAGKTHANHKAKKGNQHRHGDENSRGDCRCICE